MHVQKNNWWKWKPMSECGTLGSCFNDQCVGPGGPVQDRQVRWQPTKTNQEPKPVWGENNERPTGCADGHVHAGGHCAAGLTPVSGVLCSGHQPPMFSPSIGVVLSEALLGSWNRACPSNSKSSCEQDRCLEAGQRLKLDPRQRVLA